MLTRFSFAGLLVLSLFSSHGGWLASDTTTLNVVASEIPPCVTSQDGVVSGFSIELWRQLASEINVDEKYELVLTDFTTKMNSVESGEADVALGCISVFEDREKVLDFTHPIAVGGFQAVSLKSTAILPTFSAESRNMLLVLLGFVVIFAHVMWLAERGNTAISDHYFPGIFESVWFSIVTMSTVGYGDIAPRNWGGRISALALILSGVAAFGVIVSQFTADAIADSAENPLTDIQDLQLYRVATKEGTAAEQFLNSLAVETATYADLDEMVDSLEAGDADLLLYDSLATVDLTNRIGNLVETGPVMKSHYLALALPQGSALREPLNAAILKFQDNGLLDTIRGRWF